MKNIEFRGLTKENKFVYGYYFLWKKRNKNLHIIGEGVQNGSVYGDEVDPKTISQYTGLKDSTQFHELTKEEQENWLKSNEIEDWKGKKIFGGDIVEDINNNNSLRYGENNNLSPVEFYNGSFGISVIFDGAFVPLYPYEEDGFKFKVVGNIHQNHELLERK